jgi:hypothetical protein
VNKPENISLRGKSSSVHLRAAPLRRLDHSDRLRRGKWNRLIVAATIDDDDLLFPPKPLEALNCVEDMSLLIQCRHYDADAHVS